MYGQNLFSKWAAVLVQRCATPCLETGTENALNKDIAHWQLRFWVAQNSIHPRRPHPDWVHIDNYKECWDRHMEHRERLKQSRSSDKNIRVVLG